MGVSPAQDARSRFAEPRKKARAERQESDPPSVDQERTALAHPLGTDLADADDGSGDGLPGPRSDSRGVEHDHDRRFAAAARSGEAVADVRRRPGVVRTLAERKVADDEVAGLDRGFGAVGGRPASARLPQ